MALFPQDDRLQREESVSFELVRMCLSGSYFSPLVKDNALMCPNIQHYPDLEEWLF